MNIRNRIPYHLRPGVRVSDAERCTCEVAAVTGSHNFSKSASTKNDENLIVITGDPTLAEAYTVNVIAAFDRYRCRAFLTQHPSPFNGLKDNDT